MLVQRITIRVGMFATLLMLTTVGHAQMFQPYGPTYSPSGATTFNSRPFIPFIEPGEFDPDFQWFAPAEIGEFGESAPGNTGFFLTYDRVYTRVDRPRFNEAAIPATPAAIATIFAPVESAWDSDFGWGNLYELGYMTEENHGWMVTVWDIQGPNVFDTILVPELDFDPDDPENDPDDDAFIPGNDQIVVPVAINAASYSSVEVNKVFRLRRLHYGGIIEPFMGLRYSVFKDFTRIGRVETITTPDPEDPDPMADPVFAQLAGRVSSLVENKMFGGQLGFRYAKQRGHWKLSGDFRAFAMHNWQFLSGNANSEQIFFDELFMGDEIGRILRRRDFKDRAEELVFGGEVRLEAAFEVWRDVALRVGYDWTYLAKGIARGVDFVTNDQDVTFTGVTFGFDYKR